MNLYELTDETLRLQDILESENLPEETVEAAMQAFFENCGREKIESYCKLYKSFLTASEAHNAESKSQQEKARAKAAKAERLKDRLKWFMETTGKDKLDAGVFTVRIQAHGGKAPLGLDEVNPEALPERFRKVTIEVDSAAVREALEQGESLDWARILERGRGVRIA